MTAIAISSPASRMLGGILLITGTTIGAGMLALPISTGIAGFYPSMLLFTLYWIYMTFTAFLFLEVNLWMGGHANIISMAKRTLGCWGQAASWVVYLFLLYSLTAAYIAGGGPLFLEFIAMTTGINLPSWMGPIPLLIIFGYFIFKGTRSVDYLNRILMAGLGIALFLLIAFIFPHGDISMLSHRNWTLIALGVSVVATSFGFHIVIPTLTTYLHRDVSQLRKVILIGSIVPYCIYVIWNFLALKIIPIEGSLGLLEGYKQGASVAHILATTLNNPWISMTAQCFTFFVIVTSFLGVSLSLMDFLADGLNIEKSSKGKGLLFVLTFLPPLLFTYANPRAFFSALEYAGAFGVILLLGILPILMVWRGRYHHRLESTYEVAGGKPALIVAFAFSAMVIALEIANQAGLLHVLLKD